MRIYNYLFYKCYLLGKWSGNFDDIPVLGGIMFIAPCVMFNIFTICGFIEALGIETGIDFKKEYKYVFSFSLLALLLFYYQYKGRYKRILKHYEEKELYTIQLHPVLVIAIYYLTSLALLFLVGAYKHRLWIFS